MLVVGCASPTSSVTPISKTQAIDLPLVTTTPNLTDIPHVGLPTASLTPTIKHVTPTTSPTHTIEPSTNTPQPTLPAEEIKTLIFDLMQDNGVCRLPCLWGLVTGQTNLEILDDFMAHFEERVTTDVNISKFISNKGGIGNLIYRENNIQIHVDLSYYTEKQIGLKLLNIRGRTMYEQGEDRGWENPDVAPIYGDESFNQTFQYYMLSQILTNYGQPTKVWLRPFPDEPGRPDIKWHPFSLVLFYEELGIFVEYEMPRETIGNNYVGCPSQAHLSVAVWDPESDVTLEYVVRMGGILINELNMDSFKTVEDATSMTLGEFYTTFMESDNTKCIETPIGVWLR
jgi:hypothetical protein